MTRLLLLGTLSAFFFSSTFVLNRAISLDGGHWVWTASLRFGYMLAFLSLYWVFSKQINVLADIVSVFRKHWQFWVFTGSIGLGIFYSLICFSASFAPGWIVATTWQTTILATPAILGLMGKKVPLRGCLFTAIIFIGILVVNIGYATSGSLKEALLCSLAVGIAAIAYPLGNQLVWESAHAGNRFVPHIPHSVMSNSVAVAALLVLGSIPFWIGMILITSPGLPTTGQLENTAIVALLSGVVATSMFLHTRSLAANSYELAAVDSTQSLEIIFTLFGEIILFNGSLPNFTGIVGIIVVILGLVGYASVK